MAPDRPIENFDPADRPRGHTGILSDEHAEGALLGACLLSADAVDTAVAAGVTQDCFVGAGNHGLIWSAITDAGSDPVAVANQMARQGWGTTDELGAQLVGLQARCPAISNAASYARIVVDCKHNRRVENRLSACLNGQFAEWRTIVGDLLAEADSWSADTSTESIFMDLEPVLDGDAIGEPPTIGRRDDGVCAMFYAGQLNNIIGESESGKSLLMQWFSAAELRAGRHVFWLDFEKDAGTVTERLVSMGADRDAIVERFHYTRRDSAWTPGELAALRSSLTELQPTLCVVDGVTNAMQLEGHDPNSATDVSKFYGGVPTILHGQGAASVVIDHLNKNRDNRPPGATGSQHKRSGITGTSLELRMKEPAGRGRTGTGFLVVDKDAPGYLRAYAVNGRNIADVTIHSDGDSITVHVVPSSAAENTRTPAGAFRPTMYMERVSKVLEGFSDGTTKRTIRAAVSGRGSLIDEALAVLEVEGYAHTTPKGSAHVVRSLRPYREAMDAATTNREPQASDAEDLRVEDEPPEWDDDEPF